MAERTVKVRIAVAVDSSGRAVGISYPGIGDSAATVLGEQGLLDEMQGAESYHWVTAELPIPAETEVEGEVTDG